MEWDHLQDADGGLVCVRQQAGLGWKWKSLSCVRLFMTPWTTQSMEFFRPEYWSGKPFPSPGDLPNPGIEPRSLALWADSLLAVLAGKPKSMGSKWWRPSGLHSSGTPWAALKAWNFCQLHPTILISPFVHLYFPLFGHLLLSSVGFINANLSQAAAHLKGGHQTDDDQHGIQPNSQRMPGKGFQGWP